MLRRTLAVEYAASKQDFSKMLTLKHFVLRSQGVSLYRNIVRESRGIANPQARRETIDWIRAEFDATRTMTDQELIKDRLQQGHRLLRQLSGQWQLASSVSPKDLPKLRGRRFPTA